MGESSKFQKSCTFEIQILKLAGRLQKVKYMKNVILSLIIYFLQQTWYSYSGMKNIKHTRQHFSCDTWLMPHGFHLEVGGLGLN